MDIDAIILFYNAFQNKINDEHTITLMKSLLKNKNIDINLSIKENALKIKDNIAIKSIIESRESFVDLPIYVLLLGNSRFNNLIIENIKNNNLNEGSIYNIINLSFQYLKYLEDEEYRLVALFIMKIISSYKPYDSLFFRISEEINFFVYNNYSTLYKSNYDLDDSVNTKEHINKMLIYKLFSYGYVSFDFSKYLPKKPIDGIKEIVSPLILMRNYEQLKLIINNNTIVGSDIEYLRSVVESNFEILINNEGLSARDLEARRSILEKIDSFNQVKKTIKF